MSGEYFEEEEFEGKYDRKTLRRILGLTLPHWKYLVTFLCSIMLVAALDSVFTYLSKLMIDDGIVAKNASIFIHILAIYGGLIIVQAGIVFLFIYMAGLLGERITYDLRKKMFNHLQRLSLSYYSRTPVGWIIARVTSDSGRVSDLVTWGLVDLTWAVMNITTAMIFMTIINWKLALIVFFSLPILVYVAFEFRKRILAQYRNVRKMNSKITGAYNENITGVRVIKALTREKENLREFSQLTDNMYQAAYRAAWLSAIFLPSVQLISAVALAAVVWYGGLQAQVGMLTVGGIQAFISYITFMMWPIQDLARIFAEMQQSIASAERIFSMIDSKPQIADRDNAIDPGSIKGDIIFDNVSFTYEDGEVPVLKNFSLHVKAGETIALVGPTGGGKTTTTRRPRPP